METAVWYVLLTSASGNNCFATLGPYVTRELAEAGAVDSKAAHYRVAESPTHPGHAPSNRAAPETQLPLDG
jgi:hypothetical protein